MVAVEVVVAVLMAMVPILVEVVTLVVMVAGLTSTRTSWLRLRELVFSIGTESSYEYRIAEDRGYEVI